MIKLRLGKSGSTGIGCKKSHEAKTSLKRTPLERKNRPLRTRSRTSKRGREASLFPLVRALVVREYEMQHGDGWCDDMECDHIKGRNAEGFALTAMLDPQNLQMLEREVHRLKTDAGHHDLRTVAMKARLVALSEKIIGEMPEVWTLRILKNTLVRMAPEEPF